MYIEILDYIVRIAAIIIFTVVYKVIKEYNLERLVRSLVYAAEKYKELGGEEKYEWVRSKVADKMNIDEEKLDILIESFVSEINAQKKKEYVLEYLQEKNLNISEDDLDVMIESAVQELNIVKEK